MLSLRSLAFILCSAIRRARALSCAALHCFPDIINGRKRRKMATNNETKMATNMAAPMCSLPRTVYTSQGDHGSGRKGPPLRHHFRSNGPYNAQTADAASPEQGHLSLRLSRQAIASSSTRIASATGTTGRAWNSKAGSIEQGDRRSSWQRWPHSNCADA